MRQSQVQLAALRGQKRPAEGKGKGKGKGKKGRRLGVPAIEHAPPITLKTFHNGTPLCAAYNKGSCPGTTCRRTTPEKHACNGKLPGKDPPVACGQPHMSISCRRCARQV